ncbi:MAG: iron-sulfur binding hydrogenase [Thermoplasmata archaeon]|nr:iron-sulfur binding hydrogenase [Thermoplasmata archaeon]
MKLTEIIAKLGLKNINKKPIDGDMDIRHGYCCDLLSNVLSSTPSDSIWMTIQSHLNIIGVATMTDIPAVIICEGFDVPDNVIDKADEENIAIFKSQENAYQLSGKLYECGIR